MVAAFLLACSIIPVSWSSEETLVFAIDVIRHGDRTPEKGLSTVHHQWAEGLGQLTPVGMQQEYQLGKSKRSLYVDQYHLLPANYTAGTVFVRSTGLDRTLMSAESFMMGLYPPGTGPHLKAGSALPDGYQPVPIRTVPGEEEKLLYPDGPLYHYDHLMEQYVYPAKDWQAKTRTVRPNFTAWSQATGVKITNIRQLFDIGDALYIGRLYHVPPPSGLSEKDVDQIIETGQWAFVRGFQDKHIGKITGRLLLKTITGYFEAAIHNTTTLKYVLFSAHDSTLLSQMSALGVPLNQRPHYASNLNFSLFKQGASEYRIRINFNGEPVFVPKCGGASCTLGQFMSLVK